MSWQAIVAVLLSCAFMAATYYECTLRELSSKKLKVSLTLLAFALFLVAAFSICRFMEGLS